MNIEKKLNEASEKGKQSATYQQLKMLAEQTITNEKSARDAFNGLEELIIKERSLIN
jgi:hypothetical protein